MWTKILKKKLYIHKSHHKKFAQGDKTRVEQLKHFNSEKE